LQIWVRDYRICLLGCRALTVTFKRDVSQYGDNYYLVVRCAGGWAAESHPRQAFAVVVEIAHEAEVQLYERLRQRVRLQV